MPKKARRFLVGYKGRKNILAWGRDDGMDDAGETLMTAREARDAVGDLSGKGGIIYEVVEFKPKQRGRAR